MQADVAAALAAFAPAGHLAVGAIAGGAAALGHALPAEAGIKTAVSTAAAGAQYDTFLWGLPKLPLYYTNVVDSFVATPHPDYDVVRCSLSLMFHCSTAAIIW